jgi:hypothetical protein
MAKPKKQGKVKKIIRKGLGWGIKGERKRKSRRLLDNIPSGWTGDSSSKSKKSGWKPFSGIRKLLGMNQKRWLDSDRLKARANRRADRRSEDYFGATWQLLKIIAVITIFVLTIFIWKVGLPLLILAGGGYLFVRVFGKGEGFRKRWKAFIAVAFVVLTVSGLAFLMPLRMGISDVNVNMWGFKIKTPICRYGYQYYDIGGNSDYTYLPNMDEDEYNHINNWGTATLKTFQIDLDPEFNGMCNIEAGWEEDSIFCKQDGTPTTEPEYRKVTKTITDADGNQIEVNMYELYLKIEFDLEFTADFTYDIDNGYFGSASAEIVGSFLPAGWGSEETDFGGVLTDGWIVFQIDAERLNFGGEDEDDFGFVDTAVIDVECISKVELWQTSTLSDQSVSIFTKYTGLDSNPFGNGRYVCVPTIGDMLFYRTLVDAQEQANPIGRDNADDFDPSGHYERIVYVPIRYEALLGCNFADIGILGSIASIEFVSKYDVHLEYVYTVLTAYSDLDLDHDNDNEEEENLSILQKVEIFFKDLWLTTYGKIILIAGGSLLGVFVVLPFAKLIINRPKDSKRKGRSERGSSERGSSSRDSGSVSVLIQNTIEGVKKKLK